MDFSSSALSLFPLLGSQGPLSGITVDDNLASVFIFLFSADNDRGTKATEKLWEDKRSRTEMVGGGHNSLAERIQASLSSDYRGGQTFQNEAGCLIQPQLIRAPIILCSCEHCLEAGLGGQPVVCVSIVRILWRTLTTHGCRDGDVSMHFSPDWMSQQPMDGN